MHWGRWKRAHLPSDRAGTLQESYLLTSLKYSSRVRAQLVAAHLAIENSVAIQDRPEAEDVDGNRDHYQSHSSPQLPEVAQQFLLTYPTYAYSFASFYN
jgi:hypothetical protein